MLSISFWRGTSPQAFSPALYHYISIKFTTIISSIYYVEGSCGFDMDLLTQNVNLESHSDLHCAVDTFMSTCTVVAAMGKAHRRWTKLFSVLQCFSIRVALKRKKGVGENWRYSNGLWKKKKEEKKKRFNYICKYSISECCR